MGVLVVNPRATRSEDTAASCAIFDRLRAESPDGGVVASGDMACSGRDCEMNVVVVVVDICCCCCGMAIGADNKVPTAIAAVSALAKQPGHMYGLPARFSCRSIP